MHTLSRRRLIAAASITAAADFLDGVSRGSAKAPMPNTQAPAFYRFQVGSFEATIVSDGPLALGAPERTFFGPSRDEIAKMMTDHFLPADNMVLEQNALVINTGDKLALFETGFSSVLGLAPTDELARLIEALPKRMGRLTQNLKIAGIDPKDIDAVIPSHAHIDHIGGILAEDGSLNFPNAQIYISQVDFDYWTDEARRRTPAGVRAQTAHMLAARKNLLPNRDRILFYSDGKEVIPGVQAMNTPGHTYGHTCFVIESAGKSLYVGGDLVHHELIVEKPQMEDAFDTDRKLGIETRLKTMGMLAGDRMLSLLYHLAWPGLGHFTRRGDGFHFEPEFMQMR